MGWEELVTVKTESVMVKMMMSTVAVMMLTVVLMMSIVTVKMMTVTELTRMTQLTMSHPPQSTRQDLSGGASHISLFHLTQPLQHWELVP